MRETLPPPALPGQAEIDLGERALMEGDWQAAAEFARRSLTLADAGEAHVLLAVALWCGSDTNAAIDEMKLAYRRLLDTGMVRRAAWCACWTGVEEALTHGDRAVASGWFGRAERLLEDLPECPEQGWLLLARASFSGDSRRLEAAALEAEVIADHLGSRDLELSAHAAHGLALVLLGQVNAGMALLDETMAGVTGGDTTAPLVIGDCFCVTLAACELAQDYARAEEWCRIGLGSNGNRPNGFLKANCLASYGWILGVLGRTHEGEAKLRDALAMFNSGRWRLGHRQIRGNVLVKLADLERRRGNRQAASKLLLEGGDSVEAMRLGAELALDQGQTTRALTLAREIDTMTSSEHDTRRVLSLQLTVRAAAAGGESALAQRCLDELRPLAEQIATSPARAWLALATAAARGLSGDTETAVAADREAARLFADCGSGFDAAQARLHEAAVLRTAGRAEEAGHALAAARRLLAQSEFGRDSTRLTRRETEVLRLLVQGLSNPAIARELRLSPHTVHRHVASVLHKLEVPTRTAAAAAAVRLGLS
ncbi:MAG TPA: LuxR C-terminal-related transcriptional regulator [Candidatus Saccharimonadales bacterium]|nr:LuxR C-terminal-related transcriptional regulator [Candidatus Saccharimonadales bacterium]